MRNQTVTAPKGFRAGAAAAGIKKQAGALDVGVVVADARCPAAAVFTQNKFCGAPVTVGRAHIRSGYLRAFVVNSGCSNVATGQRGIEDARTMCTLVGDAIGADAKEVIPASTGVIGHFLPMDKIERGVRAAIGELSDSATAGTRFAQAIMTTDLRMKQAHARFKIGQQRVTVAGCCKGSGMIAPNMATMLGFITTDAKISPKTLRLCLRDIAGITFNRVTVDECPSTSDMVAIMASGRSANVDNQKNQWSFWKALRDVCEELAYAIAEDGEGATRVIEVAVEGAQSAEDAHRAARAIAASPLVKTAVHGGDPNWGRIVQALGASKAKFAPNEVAVWLGRTRLFANGEPIRGLDLSQLSAIMKQKRVPIRIKLGTGKFGDRVLTCDLSREYIAINADYMT